MAKKAKGLYGKAPHVRIQKGSAQGRHPNPSTMNKHKRRSYKKYRGQGR